MLSLGLAVPSPVLHPRQWSQSGAVLDFDFRYRRFMQGGSYLAFPGGQTRATQGWAANSAGEIEAFASLAPRQANGRGLLSEPATTAYCNASFAGAATGVVGSGGSFPTNQYASSNGTDFSRDIVALGTDALGRPYMDLRMWGTNSGGGTAYPHLELYTPGAPAALGQTWTLGITAQLIAGSFAGLDANLQCAFQERTSAMGYLSQVGGTSMTGGGAEEYISLTATTAQATVGRVLPIIAIAVLASKTVDFTLRIKNPQLEKVSQASAPVLGGGSGTLRGADVTTLGAAAQMSDAMTWVIDYDGISDTAVKRLLCQWVKASDATTRIALQYNASDGLEAGFANAGAWTAGPALGSSTNDGAPHKVAVSYQNSVGIAVSVDGGAEVFVSGTGLQGLDTIHFGHNDGAEQANGFLRRVTAYSGMKRGSALEALSA